MSEVAVSIKNVRKTFQLPRDSYDSLKLKILNSFRRDKGADTYKALKGVSLDIKKGEFIGILGRNGAGKSTLLKIIAEIYEPSAGSIKVKGRLVPFIELGVGFNKNLSGRDNVYLNGAMLGFSRAEMDEMYDSIVDFAELHKFMDQKLKNYSSGMKVRLAFSVAIKANADILLLDEVLAVGDAAFKRKCYEYFNTLKRDGKTIIFVTHNMSAARDYCDRAVLIEDGKVAFDGSPDEAADRYYSLFNTKADNSSLAGTGRATIESASVEVTESTLTFRLDIENQTASPLEDVVARVSVKKQNGRIVAGFDNKNIDEPFEIDLAPSEKRTLLFESANVMGTGTYIVNASLYDGSTADDYTDGEDDEEETGSLELYDGKPNITNFSVKRRGSRTPILLPAKAMKAE